MCYETRKQNWHPSSILQNLLNLTKTIIKSLSACKKLAQFFNPSLRYSQFQSSMTCSDKSILNHTHQSVIEATFAYLNSLNVQKPTLFHQFILEIQPILESCQQRDCSFMTTPTQNVLNQILIFMNYDYDRSAGPSQHEREAKINSSYFRC